MEGNLATQAVRRWFYGARFEDFILQSSSEILGELTQRTGGDLDLTQNNAWQEQIAILKSLRLPASEHSSAKIYFEYTIPRLGRRADVILIVGHVLFVIEFKAGESQFNISALDQVWDYALDLKNFHDASHGICIAPILVATKAKPQNIELQRTLHDDDLLRPIRANADDLHEVIAQTMEFLTAPRIDISNWESGRYLPTPTIIEAARALYAGHSVESISRSDAGAKNLSNTSKAIDHIIEDARCAGKKVICFVTGVPGAGKTLVGLDVANRHLDKNSSTYSVFLSGNGPLVSVLREALARDTIARASSDGITIRKGEARQKVATFIQNVHHFRDDCLADERAPPEHVVLFDEAQRAWTLEQTTNFMARKKNRPGFDQSEPEFLISCVDRHPDWAVVVCLVGGGQEINTGEAGISEWLDAILNRFQGWEVHLSPSLSESEYRSATSLEKVLALNSTKQNHHLHLATSMRSFRAESLSKFVRQVLDIDEDAPKTLNHISARYPIKITRNLGIAKQWLRDQARGSERYGIVVSSQAQRLKPHAIDVRVKTDPVKWFLDGKEETRSSFYLEDVATEFQVQGLELDWACVVWDGDLRFNGSGWSHHEFKGTRWNRIQKLERQIYLKNAYRVLLTRARQGMVLVIPQGSDEDPTRAASFYDPTFEYFKSLGLQELA
ncbi:DUF2075 domain-containing protein [Thermomonas sp.]|uniref:DUF2075 domain-containing protein n=1 Tax=Thermomonas sp. TaxID=1971895 RepID=UPI0035AE3308